MKRWINQLLSTGRSPWRAATAPSFPLEDAPIASGELQQRANAKRGQKKFDEAEVLYQQILRQDPAFWPALFGLGIVFLDTNRLVEAGQCFEGVERLHPGSVDAPYFSGLVATELNDPPRAIAQFSIALERNPAFKPALVALAPLCVGDEQLQFLEKMLRAALALDGADVDLRALLGIALHSLRREEVALVELDAVRRVRPGQIEVLINRAEALAALGRAADAIEAAAELRALAGDQAQVQRTIGWVYFGLDMMDEALAAAHTALAIDQRSADSHHQLAKIYAYMGDRALAQLHWTHALDVDSGHAGARLGMAYQFFFANDFLHGWPAYEARFLVAPPDFGPGSAAGASQWLQHRWQGEADLQGELYVWAEQGFGDTVMMLPWLVTARQRFKGNVFFVCPPELQRLAGQFVSSHCMMSSKHDIPPGALNCPLLSLPLALGEYDTPRPRPRYLFAPEDAKKKFEHRLARLSGLKVGLAWEGSKHYADDRRRSIRLVDLAPLADLPGVTFVSLQKGVAAQALSDFPAAMIHWMDEVNDFADTAALMEGLDLVISIDSSPAHLSGALGVPVWMFNRYAGEWRWGREESLSNHWYQSLRIFYQSTPGDWSAVVAQMRAELAAWLARLT